MERLFSKESLRKILESGLLSGKWSVMQFNMTAREPVLPSASFLEKHPRFLEMHFRDLDAFRKKHGIK